MVLDTFVGRQTSVEDCEVCCHPIEISYVVSTGILTGFRVKRNRVRVVSWAGRRSVTFNATSRWILAGAPEYDLAREFCA
jgi:hypothetical protein